MLILGQDLGKKNIVNIFKRSTMEIYSLQSQTRSLLIEIHSQKHFKFSFLSETIFSWSIKITFTNCLVSRLDSDS